MIHAKTRSSTALLAVVMTVGLSACSVMPPPGFPRADHVNIQKFMGGWYVIAHIPPNKTKNAYNALECYKRMEPGVIATTFTYREDSFHGTRHTMKPTGYVIEGTENAIWGMQFFWPIKLQYVITYVSEDYDTAIVARSDRDYAWILARSPDIPDSIYHDLVARVAALGYDMTELREVPQQPRGNVTTGADTPCRQRGGDARAA